MFKSVKNIGIALLSVLTAVCLSAGLALYFSRPPVALAASVNELTQTVTTDENDFTYEKSDGGAVITGLATEFLNTYTNSAKGGVTYNVRLEIPERLQNAHGDIPAGVKVAYVKEGAFDDNYYENNGAITLRITDIHTPETVFWQATKNGVFKIANEFNYGAGDKNNVTRSHLTGKVVTDNKDVYENRAQWAWMLGANDGITATVYGLDLSKLKANFIVPSPMWYDQDGDDAMDPCELFPKVELLIDEQPKADKPENGSLLRNMVISSGVTRFFSPYVKDNAIKIEDTFRSSAGSETNLTGMHFATGRVDVLSIYGLAFQRFTHLQTITLSAGVLLADGVRAFQGDNSVAVMQIAAESNANVPSFYIMSDNGAIYTGDYSYEYYDTAGYRKYLVWDYVTRYGQKLGNDDFWNNSKNWDGENNPYNDIITSASSASAGIMLYSPDSDISPITTGDGIDIPAGSIVFDANDGHKNDGNESDKDFINYDNVVPVKSLNDLKTKNDGGFSFSSGTGSDDYIKSGNDRKYIFDEVTYGGYFIISKDSTLTINYDGIFNVSVYAVRDNNNLGETYIAYNYTDKNNEPQSGKSEKLPPRNGSVTDPDYLSISDVKGSVTLTMNDTSSSIGIVAIVLTPEPAVEYLSVENKEVLIDLATEESYELKVNVSDDVKALAESGALKLNCVLAPSDNQPDISDPSYNNGIYTLTITGTVEYEGTLTLSFIFDDESSSYGSLPDGAYDYELNISIKVIDSSLPDLPADIKLNRTVTSIELNRETEFSAELIFSAPQQGELLAEMLKNIAWELETAKGVSAQEYIVGSAVSQSKNIVTLNIGEEGTYTLTATYTDKYHSGSKTYTAQCLIVAKAGVSRTEDIPAPEMLKETYVAYQKLVYVPPQLKGADGKLLTEFTFDYSATTIIGNSAFTATSIQTVIIPDRISTIEEYAFRYSNAMQVVYLPSNATYGNAVFGEYKDFRIGTSGSTKDDVGIQNQDFLTGYKNEDLVLIAPSYQVYDQLLRNSGMVNRGDTNFNSTLDDLKMRGIRYDYRAKLTYEVEIIFRSADGDKSVTVLYNQMDGDNLYVKDGGVFKTLSWTEIADGDYYYGSTKIDQSVIKDFITGNCTGAIYIDNGQLSPGIFTNTDTTSIDSWNTSSQPEFDSFKFVYDRNSNRLPQTIILTKESGSRQESNEIAAPGFQAIGTQVPDGEREFPEITVTFDFSGYPYSRFLSGFDPYTMEATYTYQKYESDGTLNSTEVSEENEDPTSNNSQKGFPYDAGRYQVVVSLSKDGNKWEGVYNGSPVSDSGSKTYILNILKREVPVPGDQQVLRAEATGAEVTIFENKAFYNVVKYSQKITAGIGGEKQIGEIDPLAEVPYRRGSYWVALELVDTYNLCWVGEGDEIVQNGDPAYYKEVGKTIGDTAAGGKFVTCKLIVSDAPAIPLPRWTSNENIGTYSGDKFTAVYRNEVYEFTTIFYGYYGYSMSAKITEYNGKTDNLPSSILNAGTYKIELEPAANYMWQDGSRGCGQVVTPDTVNGKFTVTVEVLPKPLDTPVKQIGFLTDTSGEFEFTPASDGTWVVDGYKAESDSDFAPRTTFTEGKYQVRVKLTDATNYRWRSPQPENPIYAVTELEIRLSTDYGLENPKRNDVSNPVYNSNGNTSVSSATYIDYAPVLTSEYRTISNYTYDTYDSATGKYGTATATPSPSSIREAGNYTITFSLPGADYWWTQDESGTQNGEHNKGVRTVQLTVEKAAITKFVGVTGNIEVKLPKGGTAELPAEYQSSLYTVTYATENGGLTSDGLPYKPGTYSVTLTLTAEAYRNYYFSGDARSVEGNFYPATHNVTMVVTAKTTVAPYVNTALTYGGGEWQPSDIITLPEGVEDDITEDSGTIISYVKAGNTEAESAIPTSIKDAGVYTVKYELKSSLGSQWLIDVSADYMAFNNITIDIDNPDILYVRVTVNRAELTVSGLSAENKPYDGTVEATLSGGKLEGVYDGEVTLDLTNAKAVFDDANAANDIHVTVTSIVLSGDRAFNYSVILPADLKANITPKELTLTAKENEIVYDGLEHNDNFEITGYVGDEELDVTVSESAINVGTYTYGGSSDNVLTVTLGDKTGKASNYTLSPSGTFTIKPAEVDLELEVTDTLTYQGKPISITPVVKTVNSNLSELLIGQLKTSTFSVESQTNAGTYHFGMENNAESKTVKVTLANDNFTLKAVSGTFTINAAEVTLTWTVDGKAANADGHYVFKNENYNVMATASWSKGTKSFEFEPLNVYKVDGYTYTVSLDKIDESKNASNFVWKNVESGTRTFYIDKKTFSDSEIQLNTTGFTVEGDNLSTVYDGKPHSVTFTYPDYVKSDTITYDGETNAPTNVKRLSSGEVGSYTVVLTIPEGDNYETLTKTVYLTITPKKINITWDDGNLTYNGTAQAVTPVAHDVLYGEDAGLKVIISGANLTDDKAINAGDYIANVTATNGNYDIESGDTQSFTITPAEATVKWYVDDEEYTEALTYKAEAYKVTAKAEWTVNGVSYTEDLNLSGNSSIKDAQSYKFTASAAVATNFNLTNAQKDIVINPCVLTLTAKEVEIVYDGLEHNDNYEITGYVGDEELKVTVSESAINVGTYTYGGSSGNVLTVTLGDKTGKASNYTLSASGTFTITPATVNAADIKGMSVTPKTYDGTDVADVTGGTLAGVNGETVQFKILSAKYDKADAGDRTVTVEIELNNKPNYSLSGTTISIKAYIGKAEVKAEDITFSKDGFTVEGNNLSVEYDGKPHGIEFSGIPEFVTTATVTYNDLAEKPINANAYTVKLIIDGTTNYGDLELTLTLTITPKKINITWDGGNFTYNGDAQAVTPVAQGVLDEEDAGLQVTISGDNATDDKAINAGDYVANVTAANGNYEIESGDTQSFTINPAQVDAKDIEGMVITKQYDSTNRGVVENVTSKGTLAGVNNESVAFTVVGVSYDTKQAGACQADVTIELANPNYKLTNDKYRGAATITKYLAELQADDISQINGNISASKTYDGSANVEIIGNDLHFEWIEGESVHYSLTAEYNSKNVSEANQITVTLTIDNENYGFAAGQGYSVKEGSDSAIQWTVNATITCRTLSVTLSGLQQTYTGEAQPVPTATAAEFAAGESATITVTLSDGSTGKLTSGEAINAGKYNVNVAMGEGTAQAGNYTLSYGDPVFEITPAQATAKWSSDGDAISDGYSAVYDGVAHTVTVRLTWGSYSQTIEITDGSYKDVKEDGYTFTATDESGNFTQKEWSLHISVTRAELAVKSATVTEKQYNQKTDDAIVSFVLEGYKGTDSAITAYVDSYTAEYQSKNAGESVAVDVTDIILAGDAAVNYYVNDCVVYGKIVAAGLTWKLGQTEKTYTGNALYAEIVLSGDTELTAGDYTVAYKLHNEPIAQPVNAGEYIVSITLKGDAANNYRLEVNELHFTIKPATITEIKWYRDNSGTPLQTEAVYDGAHTVLAYGVWNNGSAAATLLELDINKYKNVKDGGYTFTAAPTSNYEFAPDIAATFTLTVTPKTLDYVTGLKAEKIYNATTEIGGSGIDVTQATFPLRAIIAGDDVTVLSASGNYDDPNVGEGKILNITSVTLGGAEAANYRVKPFTETTGVSKITKARITVSGTFTIESIKNSIVSQAVKDELDRYLTYNGSTHKTIAITNSPLSKVPAVDGDNVQTGGRVGAEGGIGLGGSHPYFYLPLTSLEQYGLNINNFYGGIGEDNGDGAIITFMFATASGNAGTYIVVNGTSANKLYLEANIATNDSLFGSDADTVARIRGNYDDGNTVDNRNDGFETGFWDYADFSAVTKAELSVAQCEVALVWHHNISDPKQLADFKDEHVFDGSNRFNEYYADFIAGNGKNTIVFNTVGIGSIAVEGGGTDITEAGAYTLVATPGAGFANYKIKAGTDKLAVVITPHIITQQELVDSIAQKWINSGNGNGNLLASGTYNVEGLTGSVEATNAFAWLRDSGTAAVTLDNGNIWHIDSYYAFTVGGYGNNTQQENVYSYSATAVLTLNKNFAWDTDAAGNLKYVEAELNQQLTLNSDGTVTLTKNWYLVQLENGVKHEQDLKINGKDLSSGTTWCFGDEVTIKEPALMNQTAKASYSLTKLNNGRAESLQTSWTIEFGNGTIAQYLNSATPVGSYLLVLHIGAVEVDGKAYPQTDISYIINVGNAQISEITVADGEFAYNGTLQLPSLESITESINPQQIREKAGGVWKESAYDSYYAFDEDNITFSAGTTSFNSRDAFARMSGAPVDVKLKAELQSDGTYLFKEDAYEVHYRFKAPNYDEYIGQFKVTIRQKTLSLSLEPTSAGNGITLGDNSVSYTYGTQADGKLQLVFGNEQVLEGDDVEIRYAYYAADDGGFKTPLGTGSSKEGLIGLPKNAGSYKWIFTFDHWNSTGNDNNNYKIESEYIVVEKGDDGKDYSKPCYVWDITVNPKEIDLTKYSGFGEDREKVYNGSEQHYFTADEYNDFNWEHGEDDFTNVKINPDGSYGYHTAYVTIKNANYTWGSKFGDRVVGNKLEVHLRIIPATLSVEWKIDGNNPADEYTYDGHVHAVTATFSWTGGAFNEQFTFKDVVSVHTFEATKSDNFVWAEGAQTSISVTVKAYTITRDMVLSAVEIELTKEYDGLHDAKYICGTLAGVNGEKLQFNVISAEFNSANVNKADSVNVEVQLTGDEVNGNYVLADDGKYKVGGASILPAKLSAESIEMSVEPAIYNGETEVLEENIKHGALAGKNGEKVGYSIVSSAYDRPDAGNRTVTIAIELTDDSGNYALEVNIRKVSAVITPALLQVSVEKEFLFNGENQIDDLRASIRVTNPQTGITPEGKWFVLTTDPSEFTQAGDYKLTLTINSHTEAYGNYTFEIGKYVDTASLGVTIKPAVLGGDAIEIEKSGSYDVDVQTGNLTAVYNGSAHSVSYSLPSYVVSANVTYDGQTAAPVNVKRENGEVAAYKVVITVPKTSNYPQVEKIVYLTITPAHVDAADIRGMNVTRRAYDGTDEAQVTGGTLAGVNGEELQFSVASAKYDSKNAGTKTVTVTIVLQNGNYTLTGDTVLIRNISMGKAVVSAASVTGMSVTSKTYDGTDEAEVTGGTLAGVHGETVQFNIVSAKYDTPDAGDRTVTVEIELNNEPNYSLSGKTVTLEAHIGKAEVKADDITFSKDSFTVVGDNLSVEYDGKPHGIEFSGIPQFVTTATVTYNGDTNAPVNADEYEVVVTIVGTDNYNGTSKTVYLTITPATVNAADIRGMSVTPKMYDGTDKAEVTGGTLAGVNGETVQFNILSAKYDKADAGDRTVTVEIELNNEPNYSLSGKTVTLEAHIGKAEVEAEDITFSKDGFTVSGDNLTVEYDGKPHGIEFSGIPQFVTTATVTYNGDTSEPVNADEYEVVVTIVGTDNYNGTSKTVYLTINPKSIAASWSGYKDLVYTGYVRIPSATAKDIGGQEIALQIFVDGEAKNVGSYTATAALPGGTVNYVLEKDSETCTYDITPALVTLAQTDFTATYNGESQSLPVLQITWNGGTLAAADYEVSGADAKDAGAYTYTVTLTSGNFEFVGGNTAQVTLTINKVNATIKPLQDVSVEYDGNPHGIAAPETDSWVEGVTVTYNGETGEPVNAGKYTVVVTIAGTDNYNGTSATASLTITPAQLRAENINGISVVGKQYDGNNIATVTQGSIEGINETVAVNVLSAVYEAANAGSHTVTAELSLGSTNYALDKYSITLTGEITPKSLGVADIEGLVIAAKTYDGTTVVAQDAITSGILHGVTVEGNREIVDFTVTAEYETAAAGNAKNIIVTINVHNANYKFTDGNGLATDKFILSNGIINRAVADVEFNNGPYTYNGEDRYAQLFESVVFVNKSDTAVIPASAEIKLYADGGIETKEFVNSGEYTLKAELLGADAQNFTFVDGTAVTVKETVVKMLKGQIDGSAIEVASQNGYTVEGDNITATYNGEEHSVTFTYPGYVNSATVTYNGGTSKPVNAGYYSVTLTIAGTDNYNGASKTVYLTITPAEVTLAQTAFTATYNGESQSLPELQITWNGGELEAADYEVSGADAKDAGAYIYTVTLTSGNFKFADGNSAQVTLTINKANATIKPLQDVTAEYDGESHGIATPETDSWVEGVTVTYNGNKNAPVNAGEYKVVVLISSTKNYNGASATAKLVITRKQARVIWSGSTSFEENGAAQTPYAGVEGIPEDLVKVSYTGGDGTDGAPSQAGEYIVKVETLSDNYELVGQTEMTFTIEASKVTPPPSDPDNPGDSQTDAENGFNWDIVWYILVILTAITLIFAAVSSVVYIRNNKPE